jgi:D-amino-acid dehydrogenase
MKIAVIGAGLAGLTAAYWLAREGAEVSVFDGAAGPGLVTSSRNGSLQHPSHVEPWNSPGVLWQLLGSLGREEAAVLLRLKAVPSLLGWGLRFIRESNPQRFEAHVHANLALANYSLQQMALMREQLGPALDYDHRTGGTVVTLRSASAMDKARRWADSLRPHGLAHQVLDVAAAAALEPALAPVSGDLVGALHYPGDERGDPQKFCVALASHLAQQGVRFHFNTPVLKIATAGGRASAVVTGPGPGQGLGLGPSVGDSHATDAVVLCAASHSNALASPLGLRLPVRPVKGYSVTLPQRPSGPRLAVTDPTLHMAVVPVGDEQVRVAGTAEFCGFDVTVSPRRVANLMALLHQLYPAYAQTLKPHDIQPWTGLRPMCADGKCLIGPTRVPGLFLHTGHGQLGWTVCAGSGRALADLLLGRQPALATAAFLPARFGLN